ncbi:MAG: hypothetical protein JWQ88_1730 [Rhodoferax sp.]|nr:hypothetical protein [Rhodoferax sp.]
MNALDAGDAVNAINAASTMNAAAMQLKRSMTSLVTALMVALAMSLTLAANARAEQPPAEVVKVLPSAALVGSARLRVWGFEVYDARLWAAPGVQPVLPPVQQPALFALELRYLRAFSASEIARRSVDEMRRGASIDDAESERWQAAMRAVFRDVKPGDRITGIYRPAGDGVGPAAASFAFNGAPTGEIRDGQFAPLFFGIWLAPTTSEPAMRQALLGRP